MIASRVLSSLRGSLAVDLGTANTVVFVRGEGIVLFEPSVIAIDEHTNEVLAVGEEAMAAAIGAELPIAEPLGSMVVDIGGGTTEVAITSLGALAVAESVRVGGYEMDDAIVQHVKREHRLLVGDEGAEAVKFAVGSAWPVAENGEAEIRGRDLTTGLLRRATLTAGEIRQALTGTVERIVEAVKATLERAPAELAGDVMQRGLVLVGGGALLRGIDERLRQETGLAVTLVESPLTCVAVGAGRSLEELAVDAKFARRRARA